ncbi:hypothetical protein MesoLjLc_45840 [Mesorhizobium sp. L-8-10]|uniref:hypothetical protein n=1 Tax=Mesorhizobium sp. L-8-10 TaxID=2744523 RepID=UPI0019267988|nr:hypothetical protein [Mesorhizobium sp. L-8-10]BCH32654.1 hypothetical protein MesoLjLc_45840 [Mesorhizobium sp. L-8-10]
MMSVRLTLDIDDDIAAALNRLRVEMDPAFSLEIVAAELMRDWLIGAGYLPSDEIEEDTPTEGEA